MLQKQRNRVQQCRRHNSVMTYTQEFYLIYYTRYFQHGPQHKQIQHSAAKKDIYIVFSLEHKTELLH